MSTIRNKGRRTRDKKFIEKEEDEIGVVDVANKIEQKQEDMFDPHKYQKNILEDNLDKQHNYNLLDFAEDEEPIEDNSHIKSNITEQTDHTPVQRKFDRKKVRRIKKMINSDDDDIQEEKQQQEQNQQEIVEHKLASMKLESPAKKEEEHINESDEDNEEIETRNMQQMVSKKEESKKPKDNYVMMHVVMHKAGSNKDERRTAIYEPLKTNQTSFVYFKRYQSGFSEYFQAIGEDQRPILFCQNQRGCIGCNYYISLTKEMDKNNPAYLGKLRGNATGSIYQLYDNGQQPNKDYDRSKFRVNMAYIQYQSNFLGMNGPRKLRAILPKAKTIEDFDSYKFSEDESLLTLGESAVLKYQNKQPKWNQRLQSFALNFGGRVKQASIKNFILVEDKLEENDDDVPHTITFGKVDDSTFSLEFRHPLSLFQAFGIAMSEFDFKLACE